MARSTDMPLKLIEGAGDDVPVAPFKDPFGEDTPVVEHDETPAAETLTPDEQAQVGTLSGLRALWAAAEQEKSAGDVFTSGQGG
jgi:hypothetical protein